MSSVFIIEKGLKKSIEFKIKSHEEFVELKSTLSASEIIKFKEMILNKTDLDLFCLPILSNKIFISSKLEQGLLKAKVTGVEYRKLNYPE